MPSRCFDGVMCESLLLLSLLQVSRRFSANGVKQRHHECDIECLQYYNTGRSGRLRVVLHMLRNQNLHLVKK